MSGKDRREEAYRQEEEQYAKELLVYLYVHGESSQSDLAHELSRVSAEFRSPFANEFINRMKFDSQTRSGNLVDEANKVAEGKMLADIVPQRRLAIQKLALSEAIAFWKSKLELPDLGSDEILVGRRRLTRLSARLEALG